MIRAIIFAALVALAGCAAGQVPEAPTKPIIIRDNDGGNVHAFMQQRARLERSGRPVQIHGRCVSACVVFATMKNACLAPDSTLFFHGASGGWVDLAERRIGGVLRGEMRRLWLDEWRHTTEFERVAARRAVRLDPEIRICRP